MPAQNIAGFENINFGLPLVGVGALCLLAALSFGWPAIVVGGVLIIFGCAFIFYGG